MKNIDEWLDAIVGPGFQRHARIDYASRPRPRDSEDDIPVIVVGLHTVSLLMRGRAVDCGRAFLIPADDLMNESRQDAGAIEFQADGNYRTIGGDS